MNQKFYVNKKERVEVVVTESEYFGLHAQVRRHGILGYEGYVSEALVAKAIEKLELVEVSEDEAIRVGRYY